MPRLASQAGLCYNGVRNIVVSWRCCKHPTTDNKRVSLAMSIILSLPHGKVTVISDEDSDLAQFPWCQTAGDYVVRGDPNGTTPLRLHRIIMARMLGRALVKGEFVDHIDMDKLNNQRANLRLASSSQNHCNIGKRSNNTSGYKGVTFNKAMRKWVAQIRYQAKQISIWYFDTAEAAAKAYNDKAREIHGEFARLNVLPEGAEAIPAPPRILFRNNTSGYRGVHFVTRDQKWLATLRIDGKQVCVGRFHTPLEAAQAYNEAAIRHYGQSARLNDLPG